MATVNSSAQQVTIANNTSFSKVLHKENAKSQSGIVNVIKKDNDAHNATVDKYFSHWENKPAKVETEDDIASRKAEYASLTLQYYNIATDLYEYGFGQSFHFARAALGETFTQQIIRHEHYLAHVVGITKGMKVLDIGCGVGGPARNIARFTGAHITGLNINDYQLERAARYVTKDGLDNYVDFVKGDFMKMPFEDNTFDRVFSIEATVHAPSLAGVYAEAYRVLKPGGVFGVYEWVMTDKYDSDNLTQRDLRITIEQGGGIAHLNKSHEALAAFKSVGFELLEEEDLARRPDPIPWYWPLDRASSKHAQSWGDLLYTFRMGTLGRSVTHMMLGVLEAVGLAPRGMLKTSDGLNKTAQALVQSGQADIFTPMYLMVGRKPLE